MQSITLRKAVTSRERIEARLEHRPIRTGLTLENMSRDSLGSDPTKAPARETSQNSSRFEIAADRGICHRPWVSCSVAPVTSHVLRQEIEIMRLTSVRIPPLPEAEWTDEVRELLPKGRQPLNIFTTLVRHPQLFKRWTVFGGHILSKSTLSARDR
jgi:hypothetical protein